MVTNLCCFLASILYIFLLGIIFTVSLPHPPTVSTIITFTFLLSASKMIRKVLHHFCLRQTEVGRNNRIILTLRHTNRSNQSKHFCQLRSCSLYEELTTPTKWSCLHLPTSFWFHKWSLAKFGTITVFHSHCGDWFRDDELGH